MTARITSSSEAEGAGRAKKKVSTAAPLHTHRVEGHLHMRSRARSRNTIANSGCLTRRDQNRTPAPKARPLSSDVKEVRQEIPPADVSSGDRIQALRTSMHDAHNLESPET